MISAAPVIQYNKVETDKQDLQSMPTIKTVQVIIVDHQALLKYKNVSKCILIEDHLSKIIAEKNGEQGRDRKNMER